jgi:hypothetical protein
MLGLPPTIKFLDLDGASLAKCLIRYLRNEYRLLGIATGKNINDLSGLFYISNAITALRS